jgi:alpha-ketoglutarate-dependent taurine dioxygenase
MQGDSPATRALTVRSRKEAKRKTPPVLHPLVHRHPLTGRKALYLDRTTTVGIAGMGEAADAALLEKIYEAAIRPEFVYRHDGQVGDVVLWDNGLTMHRREPFAPEARRLLKRTTIFLSPERHIVPEGCLAA